MKLLYCVEFKITPIGWLLKNIKTSFGHDGLSFMPIPNLSRAKTRIFLARPEKLGTHIFALVIKFTKEMIL